MKILMLFIGFWGLTYAPVLDDKDKDPEAKEILQKLSTKYNAFKTISADFELKLKGEDINVEIEGKSLKKGNKYVYITDDAEVFCDGKTIWTYLKDENSVSINNVEDQTNEEDFINPSDFFNIWKKDFKYKLGEVVNSLQEIKLYPLNPKKKQFHTISLYIDKSKNELKKAKIKSRDGMTQEFILKKISTDQEISDSKFKFDIAKHPGVEVEDFRF